MKRTPIASLLIITLLLVMHSCTEKKELSTDDIIITISVKNEVIVNADTVAIEDLEAKLRELDPGKDTRIRLMPDPEAGPAAIERAQRTIKNYQRPEK